MGDIDRVDPRVLLTLVEARFVPVVASLAGSDDGDVFNVNADTVAESLAVALRALAASWRISTVHEERWRPLFDARRPHVFLLWHEALLPLLRAAPTSDGAAGRRPSSGPTIRIRRSFASRCASGANPGRNMTRLRA